MRQRKMSEEKQKESCGNCKKYRLNGGRCIGVKSRHCDKYKNEEAKQNEAGEV